MDLQLFSISHYEKIRILHLDWAAFRMFELSSLHLVLDLISLSTRLPIFAITRAGQSQLQIIIEAKAHPRDTGFRNDRCVLRQKSLRYWMKPERLASLS
jgi:hypothetical protein